MTILHYKFLENFHYKDSLAIKLTIFKYNRLLRKNQLLFLNLGNLNKTLIKHFKFFI